MASVVYNIDLTNYRQNKKVKVDATGVGGITYIGLAARPEAADTDPHWLIVRETVGATVTTVEWAGGGGYDNVWSNRAALTYSQPDASQP